MKNFFSVAFAVFSTIITFFVYPGFCQDFEKVEVLNPAVLAQADRVELISAVSYDLPVQPLRIIDDVDQIKNIGVILKSAVLRQPCDCLPEYIINFYKKDTLLAAVSFGPHDGFLRYGGSDYILPQELLSFLEL